VAVWIRDPDPYRDSGKTCLGGGMHGPSASSLYMVQIGRNDGVMLNNASETFGSRAALDHPGEIKGFIKLLAH